MKKRVICLLFAFVLLLSTSAGGKPEAEQSVEVKEPAFDEQPDEEIKADAPREVDPIYFSYVDKLGYLQGKGWSSPEEIDPTNYVMWCAYLLQEEYGEAFSEFVSENWNEQEDQLCIPADILEPIVFQYFYISIKYLRSNNILYNEERKDYCLDHALYPLAEIEHTVLQVNEEEDRVVIEMESRYNGKQWSEVLTLTKGDDVMKYFSYETNAPQPKP